MVRRRHGQPLAVRREANIAALWQRRALLACLPIPQAHATIVAARRQRLTVRCQRQVRDSIFRGVDLVYLPAVANAPEAHAAVGAAAEQLLASRAEQQRRDTAFVTG